MEAGMPRDEQSPVTILRITLSILYIIIHIQQQMNKKAGQNAAYLLNYSY